MIDYIILWLIRIGAIFLVLNLFLTRKKQPKLLKVLDNKNNFYKSKQTKLVKYLDNISDNGFFKMFKLKPNSENYNKINNMLIKTGNENGLTVDIIQSLKVSFPIIVFILGIIIMGSLEAINKFALMSNVKNHNVIGNVYSFLQPIETTQINNNNDIFKKLVILLVISLLSYRIPNLYLKYKINKRNELIKNELNIIESFTVVMLDTGNFTVYEILKTISNSNNIEILKPIIFACTNEYFINPQLAIQNMSDKIQDEEFQVICNTLKEAVDKKKDFINKFMNDNIEQIKKYQRFEIQKKIKQKPIRFVFLLAIPLFNIVIIWIYPWVTKVFKMLTGGFSVD